MNMEEKKKMLLDTLSTAYSDPKVKEDKDLQNMIFEFAQEINTTKNVAHSCVLFVPKMNALVSINAFHVQNIPNTVYKLIDIVHKIASEEMPKSSSWFGPTGMMGLYK
ncbi:hypothetical protein RD055328_03870 [Companilactobacillus sp. RD055328]|uniref:hypothetical protein n=1 Tax=Companilactobacillus sp. RD055328 TaxID=2916634 RepID=UPI001FC8C6E3|nr:hypothetical protein [Companilactobacillus sp. RD055328]GKQ42464.1 hypothetical protein RD055328_03870 [Companilactobacillus sp. RD055328]